jgi:hypothetical protein
MAENVKDPVGASCICQEKLSSRENEVGNGEFILRVLSRKSIYRAQEKVVWTEEVKKLVSLRKTVNSADTIVTREDEDRGLVSSGKRLMSRSYCI